jgi:predicted dehydrogenase
MIKVAIVGVGFMGWIHYLAYQRTSAAQLVGFCSRDAKKRAGDWRGIQGNFGPPGEQIDVSAMKVWQSYEELLADPDVELVDLCLPPHLHAEATLAALKAEKHVFVEKPIGHTVLEGRAMVKAAREHARMNRTQFADAVGIGDCHAGWRSRDGATPPGPGPTEP